MTRRMHTLPDGTQSFLAPPETMWAAALRLWNEAQRELDLDKRALAVRLRDLAEATGAAGQRWVLP